MKAVGSYTVLLIVLIVLAVIFFAVGVGGTGLIQEGFKGILRLFPQLAGITGNTPETALEQAIYASYLRCAEGCDSVINSPHITDDSVLAQACGRNRDEKMLMQLFDENPNDNILDRICDREEVVYKDHSSQWAIKVNPKEHFVLDRILLAADCMVDPQSPRGHPTLEGVIKNLMSLATGGSKWAFVNGNDLTEKTRASDCLGRPEYVVFQSGTTEIDTWVSTEKRAGIHKFTYVAGGFAYCRIDQYFRTTPCTLGLRSLVRTDIRVSSTKRLYNEIDNENLALYVISTSDVKLTLYKVENGKLHKRDFSMRPGDEISFCKYKFKLQRLEADKAEFEITYNPAGKCPWQ